LRLGETISSTGKGVKSTLDSCAQAMGDAGKSVKLFLLNY